MIFVFGSNLSGIHGAGAARHAMDHEGAVMRVGVGRQGNAYAIPTKDYRIESLPLEAIKSYANLFLTYAVAHPELQFKVTQIGCGLAGFTRDQIAPMFWMAPSNCYFDRGWGAYLPETAQFWN